MGNAAKHLESMVLEFFDAILRTNVTALSRDSPAAMAVFGMHAVGAINAVAMRVFQQLVGSAEIRWRIQASFQITDEPGQLEMS